MKFNKKKITLFLILLTVAIVVIFGTSYAYFIMSKNSNKQTFTSGVLSVEYKETSNVINLQNAFPLTEEQGKNTTPHEFTVENTGTVNANYQVRLELDTTIQNQMDLDKIRISYRKNDEDYSEPVLLSDLGSNLVIDTNQTLGSGNKDTYEVYLWIDYEAGNEIQGKEFGAKIVVDSVQEYADSYLVDTAPIIKLNEGDVKLLKDETYTEYGVASIVDDKDTLSIDDVKMQYEYYDGTNLSTVTSIDTSKIGIYYITYTISDSSHNVGKAVRVITINNTETIPTITLNEAEIITLNEGDIYVEYGATIDSENKLAIIGEVKTSVIGTYIVRYIVIDSNNNLNSVVRTIVVNKKLNGDTTLKSLTVSEGTLSPSFTADNISYTLTVSNKTESIDVEAISNSSSSVVSGTGTKALEVGNNTIEIVVTAEDQTTKTYTITVRRMAVDTIELATVNKTYTGSPITASQAISTSGTEITYAYYSSTDCSGTTLSDAPTDAGNYSVKATSAGNDEYESGSICVAHTINKKEDTVELVARTEIYTGSEIKANEATSESGTEITYTYYSSTDCSGDELAGAPTDVGNYSVKATSAGNNNYSSGSICVAHTISKQDDIIELEEKTATYTGDIIEANEAKALSNTGITYIYYASTDCSGAELTVAPTDVGNYSVKAISVGNNNYSSGSICVKHTITQGTPTISLEPKTAAYTGYAIPANEATATKPNKTDVTLNYTYTYYSNNTCTTSIGTTAPTNVGTYYVKATSETTTNLKSASSDCVLHTINKASDTVSITAKSTAYTGSAIAANTASSTSGSSITYTYYSSTDCSGTALSGAPTNVGEYSVKATSAGNSNYSSGYKCVTHTITSVNATNPTLTDYTGTYDGQAHTITVSGGSGGTIQYSTDNSTWSTTKPTRTNAGTTTVYVRILGDDNHNTTTSISAMITINKAVDTVSISPKSAAYTGNPIAANTASATSGTGITYIYYSSTDCSGAELTGAPTNVGEYSVKAISVGNSNYSSGYKCVTHTITKVNATNPALTAYTGTYDGQAHTITVSGGSGGTIQYSTDNSTWSTTKPTLTNVGTTTVYVRVLGDDNHNTTTSISSTITISKATDTVSITAKSTGYTGSAIAANTASATSGTTITYTYYSSTDCSGTALSGAPTNVGEYSVKATSAGNSNYSSGYKCVTHTITKVNATNPTLTAYTGTYDGQAHTITVSGGSGGTIQYSTDNSTWSTTKPTRTAAGTTTVYVRVLGDSNHNTTTSTSATITINKAADTVSITAKSTTYTGSAIAANTASSTSGSSITYTYYSSTDCSGTALSGAPTDVGEYSVKATSAGNSNYSSGYKCVTHTITKGTPTISLSAKSAMATGSAITANAASATKPNGSSVSLSYTYTYYSNNSCTTALSGAPSSPGTYYVKATSTATTNLNSASSGCITHTITANTNTNLSALSVSNYSISPTFASGTTEYAVTTEASSITINATPEVSLTSVSGTGSKTVAWGISTFDVVTTSQSNATKTYTITVTNIRPGAPTITGGTGTSTWTTANTTISVSTSGTATSGIKHYEYYTTTSTTAPTDSTTATGTTSGNVTISANGITYVYYRTVSNNGFKSVWSSAQVVKKDSDTPTAPTIVGGTGTSIWDDLDRTISISTAGSATSGVKHYEYYTTTSSTAPTSSTTADGTTSNSITISIDGITYVYYRTVSNSGMKSAWSNVAVVQKDSGTPTTPTITGGTGTSSWTTSATISISKASTATSGIKHYEYYKSTSSTAPSSSTTATGTTSGSLTVDSNGTNNVQYTYYVYYRAVSNVGAKSSWSSVQVVKIDTNVPTAPTITGGSDSWTTSYRTISLTTYTPESTTGNENPETEITGASTSPVGIKKYQYYISTSSTGQVGGSWNDCTTSSISQKITANGVSYIYFRAISNSGMEGTPSAYQITKIDSVSPTVSVNINDTIPTFVFTDNVGVVGYGVNKSTSTQPNYTTINSTTSGSQTYTSLSSSTYVVWVKDAAGNSTYKTFTITGSYAVGDTWNYVYTGDVQTFKAPQAGTYQLDVYGAQGGGGSNEYGGKGGYSTGQITLTEGQTLYIYIGGKGSSGSDSSGGYNGGGKKDGSSGYRGTGGGATHIAKVSGLLSELSSQKDQVLIVAGGGGGYGGRSGDWSKGGAGGGTKGTASGGGGGTQTAGGSGDSGETYDGGDGKFGQGGTGETDGSSIHGAGGGGGGWYGGGGGVKAGGGGGSGYIGGVTNGTTTNGQNEGNGSATITIVTLQ